MPPEPPETAEPAETAEAPGAGRTRHGLALGLAAASVMPVVLGGATASAAPQRGPVAGPATRLTPAADQRPACGDPASAGFPIDTRIHGGPDTYASGGGYGTWFLDLTNTTTESCRAIHPVVVLTDEERALTSDQIQLQFSERARPGVEHRVTWETTDRDEHIGVFGGEDDAFPGFTVPAGRTVTVQVRLAFTSDTSPGRITANAAIVQRRGGGSGAEGDGEWVGESEDYPFSVVEPDEDTTGTGETGEADGDRESGDGTGRDHVGGTGEAEEEEEGSGTVKGKGDEGYADPGRTGTTRRPVPPGTDPAGVPQLADTGISVPVSLPALTVSGFLIGGGAMVLAARRTRRADH
ncbi:hypothetical protein FKN01_03130 [Streptomyces sp. 130]|uniref:hypothetical protein n=1 Tax=Streptomyces sp. 130 TaxID=2591006 RepID=UPI00117F1EBB|nr:hypothetical protein [Streptomyces sp. 130]TRV81461.1 hypothetical protein FKN01_03130 [Streptomyces sp. 130]